MALGKGLGALIPQRPSAGVVTTPGVIDYKNTILHLDPNIISVNSHQPRTHFDPTELENLMNSIKVHGIISPLVATKREDGSYELIAGERRLRSAKALGLQTVPVIIRDVKEQEKLEIALIENIQRKQLSAIEEAYSYERLLSEFNLTQDEVAKRVGKSRSTVANMLRLLELPQEVQQAIIDDKISEGHARAIASLATVQEQLAMLHKIIEAKISVREVEAHVQAKKGIVRKTFDPVVAEYEQKLTQKFGSKVKMVKKGTKGSITFNFSNLEDLKGLLDSLLS